jgi:hypothetical protein
MAEETFGQGGDEDDGDFEEMALIEKVMNCTPI